MELAYFIYLTLLIVVLSFGFLTKYRKVTFSIFRWDIIVPVFVVSLLMGIRYEVGTDWENYRTYYELIKMGSEMSNSGMEPLYLLINEFIAYFQFPYQVLFFAIMFMHLLLFYKSFDRYLFLLPLGIYFYFTTVFFTSLNIQRQTLSFCVFLFSLRYLIRGNLVRYLLCASIAALFHYSSLILFPIYFLRYKFFGFLDNKWLQLSLYVFFFFIGAYLLDFIMNILAPYITNAKYLNTLKALGSREMEVSSGLGLIVTALIDICLIIYAPKLSKVYQREYFQVLFRVFFVGILLSNAFGLDVFLSRVPFVLESLRFLMLAFWGYYLFNIRKTIFSYCLGGVVLLLYFGMFIVGIFHGNAGCSPFQIA